MMHMLFYLTCSTSGSCLNHIFVVVTALFQAKMVNKGNTNFYTFLILEICGCGMVHHLQECDLAKRFELDNHREADAPSCGGAI